MEASQKNSTSPHKGVTPGTVNAVLYLRIFLFLLCVLLAAAVAANALGFFDSPPAFQQAENQPAPSGAASGDSHSSLPGASNNDDGNPDDSDNQDDEPPHPSLPFEEPLASPLEDGIRQIDAALLETLASLNIARSRLELIYVQHAENEQGEYTCQRLVVYPDTSTTDGQAVPTPPTVFFAALKNALAASAPEATLELHSELQAHISVHGVITHELRLVEPLTAARDGQRFPLPRLAIVIDDMGESPRIARTLTQLNFPVTFSVWPDSTRAREVAKIGHAAGLEIMIHQPMEPVKYPEVRPGPRALLSGQTAEHTIAIITESIEKVPYAVGINNHMGSRITQDRAAMDAVCDAILAQRGQRNLFVLDSLTHARSVLYNAACAAGLRTYRRDVFLDVEENVPYILHQLDKAVQVARQRGQAIAIGHPLPATVEALKIWQELRDPGVLIVPVANLNP